MHRIMWNLKVFTLFVDQRGVAVVLGSGKLQFFIWVLLILLLMLKFQQFHQQNQGNKMKRVPHDQLKLDKNDKITMLWKKIGKVPKASNTNCQQLQLERFQTSLELQVFSKQIRQHKDGFSVGMDDKTKKLVSGVKMPDQLKEQKNEIPFLSSRVKMTKSTYDISSSQYIDQDMKNKVCQHCLPRYQQLTTKLKQQIKLYLIDFSIMRENIYLEMRNFWNLAQQIIQQKSTFSQNCQFQTNFQSFYSKLTSKRSAKQKLQYIEQEQEKRKEMLQNVQKIGKKLRQQIRYIENAYLEIKFKVQYQRSHQNLPKNVFKAQSENYRMSSNTGRPETSFDRLSEDGLNSSDQLKKSSKTQKQKNQASQQIQDIKKKIQGLKLRLNKTGSLAK